MATWMQPVDEILSTWKSIDSNFDSDVACWCGDLRDDTWTGLSRREQWDHILDEKRRDPQYQDVLESVRTRGFLRPSTCGMDGQIRVHGDGHHRLAAAVELGLTHVLMTDDYGCRVSQDSGSWEIGDEVEPIEQGDGDYFKAA